MIKPLKIALLVCVWLVSLSACGKTSKRKVTDKE